MPLPRHVALFVLAGALVLVGGCATKQVKVGSRYVISAPKSAFYKYGPAQSFGPDTTLPGGTFVTMLESTWGFCHVMTEAGLAGYVSSDDLKPAPAPAGAPAPKPGTKLATNPRGPQSQQFFPGRPKKNAYLPTPGGPLFDVNDVPLPLPESNPPVAPVGAKPKFRY